MIKERSWKSSERLTKRIETLELTNKTTKSINNGTLSTLMNGRVNQLKDSSIRDSDFTLRETSTLFHNSKTTDTLT